MAKGTDVQVGYFAPQSKQTCDQGIAVSQHESRATDESRGEMTYLVRALRLELLKELERLLLGCQPAHRDGRGYGERMCWSRMSAQRARMGNMSRRKGCLTRALSRESLRVQKFRRCCHSCEVGAVRCALARLWKGPAPLC